MIKKIIAWLSKLPGHPKKEEIVFSKEGIKEWPFPVVSEDFDPRPCEKKKKPALKKATTRSAKKKPAVIAKKVAAKKTAKKKVK